MYNSEFYRDNLVIYYHPSFGDNTFYFSTEKEALEYATTWLGMDRASLLKEIETLTVVFN